MGLKNEKKAGSDLRLKAFTLIELLVVISIIALLLAIIMPSLKLAKQKAATAVCLANTKNLSLAWFMYQQENDGRLVGGGMSVTENGRPIGWIRKPRTINGNEYQWWTTIPIPDEDEFRGIRAGSLYPYLKSVDVMHCPADNIRRSYFAPGDKPFASYTVAACLNDPTENTGGPTIKQFGQIRRPGQRYNFVEQAEERCYNGEGRFLMRLVSPVPGQYTARGYSWQMWSPLAINHGKSSIFGFCDGHSEVRKWRDKFTIEHTLKLREQNTGTYNSWFYPEDQTNDIAFMAAGWALGK